MRSLLLIVIFCIPVLWNLLKPGFYTSHDGEWMVIRLTAFHQALREGQLPVRWLPRLNHGYGYPVTNFLYPLPFYIAEPFYVLTGNPATAVQIVMGLSVVSMAVGMYFLISVKREAERGKHSLIDVPALVGAMVYTYSPYVAFNLYQRGSLGELVAMGIVPWVFWAVRRGQLLLGSIALSSLILSHNVVAILFFPLILVFMSSKILKRKRGLRLSLTTYYLLLTTFALGLSAFFWLPALAELRFVRASTIAISDFQNEYLSINEALKRTGMLSALTNFGLPLYFLIDVSSGFWGMSPLLQVIQFPWRLLSIFSFTNAVIIGWMLNSLSAFRTLRIVFAVAFLLFIATSLSPSYLQPDPFTNYLSYFSHSPFISRLPSFYETNDDTTTVRAEYTPIWVKDLPKERPSEPSTHYYPGWRAYLNGKEVPLRDPVTTNGVLESVVKSNQVSYKWSETPLRSFSNLVSLISLLGLLYWEHRRQQKQERGQRGHIRPSA